MKTFKAMTPNSALKSSATIFVAFLLLASFSAKSASSDPNSLGAAPGQLIADVLDLGTEDQSEISIQAPASFLDWTIDPTQGPSTRQGTLFVEATGCWQIMVTANAATSGHMIEYDPYTSQYVSGGKKLKTPLRITAENGNAVDLSQGGLLAQGSGQKNICITFEQTATKDDRPLPKGHDYRISLTFTASPA